MNDNEWCAFYLTTLMKVQFSSANRFSAAKIDRLKCNYFFYVQMEVSFTLTNKMVMNKNYNTWGTCIILLAFLSTINDSLTKLIYITKNITRYPLLFFYWNDMPTTINSKKVRCQLKKLKAKRVLYSLFFASSCCSPEQYLALEMMANSISCPYIVCWIGRLLWGTSRTLHLNPSKVWVPTWIRALNLSPMFGLHGYLLQA